MKRIKKEDTVVVIAGKWKGHVGKVLLVKGDLVKVEGANKLKKHVKDNPQLGVKGGIKEIEAPLHISNVALYNPVKEGADKVGFKIIEKEGVSQKVRYFKSNNELVDVI